MTHHTTIRSGTRRGRVPRDKRRGSRIDHWQRNGLQGRVSRNPRPGLLAGHGDVRLGRIARRARACLYSGHFLSRSRWRRFQRNSRIECRIRCDNSCSPIIIIFSANNFSYNYKSPGYFNKYNCAHYPLRTIIKVASSSHCPGSCPTVSGPSESRF
jgi:hypothetical protein